MRRSALTLLVLILIAATARGAGAEVVDQNANTTPTDDGAEVRARLELGQAGAPTQSSGGTVSCSYIEVGEELDEFGYGNTLHEVAGLNSPTELVEGWWYYVACTIDGDPQPGRFFQYTPGELPLDPVFLAQEAVDTITIAYPEPQTSPPIDASHLVGIRTWLWITPDTHQPVTATASIPGLSVTATATPSSVTWDMGDGTDPIVCADTGPAYDPAVPDDQQITDCGHVFQHAGPTTASATTTWTITWAATDGTGGTLPATTRTTTFPLDVIERQAVIVDR